MNNENKVLACVDPSRYAEFVADYSAWAARRMTAPLEFLHVIDRHPETADTKDNSGAIGFDAQETLLEQLSAKDAARAKAAREQGRVFLNALRERALAAGAGQVDTRQRYGDLETTLAEQEHGVRLLVLGRQGEAAGDTSRDIGRNVERTVRALHKPILTVTAEFQEPQRVLFAFDGGATARRGVEMVAASPLLRGLPIHLLMSGKASRDGRRHLDAAKSRLDQAGFATTAALVAGDAETVIAQAVREQGYDLLIMGAYSHSPLRTWLFGSKTSDLLRSATIPTLLLR
ncbi:universal stress protein [Magnetospirillum sp. 64-120]|uniref:universal stress protein n=1 Tax=Magnetospirillum sp. 64-120 TaxID=1895778 RepID=UPI00092A550C|nr:universal stress protein [Magnetospirillum sp. 64-120]OJX78590.1 MAG: universal stress protein A [Magnetospirillum sp. 64-120]